MDKRYFFIVSLIVCWQILCATNNYNGLHLPAKFQKPISSPTPWIKSRKQLIDFFPKKAVVAEIGVQEGIFSSMILEIAKPRKMVLIDCWEQVDPHDNPIDAGASQKIQNANYQKVQKKFGRNARVKIIKSYSEQAAQLFPDDYFDWIYIDANHTYQGVSSDLEIWLPKVKNGGIIAGHDYFVYALKGAHWLSFFGVVPAVNEFTKKHGFVIEYLTAENIPSYGIRVVK